MRFFSIFICLLVALSAHSEKLNARFLTIATAGASGPYNIIGTALADIYSKTYGVNSRTQTSGGSVENINLLKQGKVDVAFVMSDVLKQAVSGNGAFKEKIKVYQIASMYPNYVQIVALKKSGIKNIRDLKGKRVAVGDQNSGVEVNARTLINGVGLSYQDMRVDYLGYTEAASALRLGRVDAAFFTSGIPNAVLLELSKSVDVNMVEITRSDVERIANNLSYFIPNVIPAGTYGNTEDIPTASILNAYVVSPELSDDDVYKITKTFFENLDKLGLAHRAARDISINKAGHNIIAPLHPGAKRYYDEVKASTDSIHSN